MDIADHDSSAEKTHDPFAGAHPARTVWVPRWVLRLAVGLPLVVLALLWLADAVAAHADVDPTGAFRTEVSITVPPFHGVTPGLGLSYSSSSGNGWIGVGWSLQGLSTIRRQSPSGVGLPQWSGADSYSLDGRALVDCAALPASDNNGASCAHPAADLRTYTTQVDTFQRMAYAPSSDTWTVWRTDGVTATYSAGSATSHGTLDWHLTTVVDRSGNAVHYEWTAPSHRQVPILQMIRYGDVTIRFQTETRPDPLIAATGEAQQANRTRLQVIDISAARTRVRAYNLQYQPEQPGQQSALRDVQEFGSDSVVDSSGVHGGTSAPKTLFGISRSDPARLDPTPPVSVSDWSADWSAPPDDSGRWSTVLSGGSPGAVGYDLGGNDPVKSHWVAADANQDGLTDAVLVRYLPGPVGLPGRTSIRAELVVDNPDPDGYFGISSGDVFGPCNTSLVCAASAPSVQTGDVNGDRATDLVLTYRAGGTANTRSTTLVVVLTGGPEGSFAAGGPQLELPGHPRLLLGDVNGDSRADLVSIGADPGCPESVQTGLSDGHGGFDFSPATACWPTSPPPAPAVHWSLADVNADLKLDLVGVLAPTADNPSSTDVIYTAVSTGQGRFDTHVTDTGQRWIGDSTDCTPPTSGPRPWCTDYTTVVPTVWLDADGDGRTDLVVLHTGSPSVVAWTLYSRGDGSYSAPAAGTTSLGNSLLTRVTTAYSDGNEDIVQDSADLVSGDVNGDGAGDLIAASGGRRSISHGADVDRSVSDHHGNWLGLPTVSSNWDGCGTTCWAIDPTTMVGDVNGDGLTDVMFAHYSADFAAPNGLWTKLEVDPTVSAPVVSHWLHGDYNGDGRADLIYPRRTATGIEVHVLVQRTNGTYQPVAMPFSQTFSQTLPAYVPVHLLQSSWIVADINGDRQDDLVNLSPGRQVGLSLISIAPFRWYVQIVNAADLDPVVGSAAFWPPGRWSVADVNGDEIDDLVHAGLGPALTQAPGVLVLYGHHHGGALPMEFSRPAGVTDQTLADNLDWRTADVDGDTHADLVSVDTAASTVTTLLRRGGSWQPVTHPLSLAPVGGRPGMPAGSGLVMSTGGDDPAWMPADVNGDGATDLVRVVGNSAGGTYVDTLFSNGDGHYTADSTQLPVAAVGGPLAGADTEHWYPVNVDLDHRTDLVRVFNRGSDLLVQTATSNGDGTWTSHSAPVIDQALTGLPATDRWMPGNIDGSGQLTLWRLDTDGSALIGHGMRFTAPSALIASVDNGAGATTTVTYRPATASIADSDEPPLLQCKLPPGISSAAVVTSVQQRDTPTGTGDRFDVRYSCPKWSVALRSLLAWTDTWTDHSAAANHPASTEHITRTVYDSGIVQPTLDEVADENGQDVQVTRSSYETVDPAASAGQRDLLAHTEVSTCAAGECATSTTDLTHDEVGNITSSLEIAAGSGRQRLTTRTYLHDHTNWLESLVQRTTVADPADPDQPPQITSTCYDGSPGPGCELPADARGLPTSVYAWQDSADSHGNPTGGGAFQLLTRVRYDEFGNPVSVTDAKHATSTTVYDPLTHSHPIGSCNALHQCTARPEPWDRRAEAPTRTVDANGAIRRDRYDALGRPVRSIAPSGAVTRTSYAITRATGVTTTTTVTAYKSHQWSQTVADGLGRIYRSEQLGGPGQPHRQTDTRYSDTMTRPWQISAPHYVGSPIRWTTFDYDAAGRTVRQVAADAKAITHKQLVRDGLAGSQDRDETGRISTHLTDGWGSLTVVEEPSTSKPGTTATTRYTYDYAGNLATVTDATGHTITRRYDSLGRQRTDEDPDRGDTLYGYDPAGNLTSVLDARGRLTTYGYDALNRRTSKTDHATSAVTTWRFDQAGHGAAQGRLTSIQDSTAIGCPAASSHRYSYDRSGNVTSEIRCVKGHTITFAMKYNQANQLAVLTYPDAKKVTYTYDTASQLRSVSNYVTHLTYTAAGQIRSARYGNGTTATWTYDRLRDRLTAQHVAEGPTTLLDLAYTYEANGLVQSSRSASNHVNETYGYDSLDRLTTVTGTTKQSLTYDDLGNLTSNSKVGHYTYPAARTCTPTGSASEPTCAGPHAVTAAGKDTYTYDATGNMTGVQRRSTTTRTLTWNTDGLLTAIHDTSVGTVRNLYDGNGERVQQASADGTVDLFGTLADWSPKQGLTTYIYADSQLIARRHAGHTSWYHTDRLGSPRLITNSAGHPVDRTNYGPWGQVQHPTATGDPHGFTGQRSLGGTGLIDLAARDYDPKLGRMLSADSIIPDSADPQALNRYSYAYNNPITYTDPSGHAPAEGCLCDAAILSGWSDFLHASQAYFTNGQNGLFQSASRRFTQTISLPTVEMTPAEMAKYMASTGDRPTSGASGVTLGRRALIDAGPVKQPSSAPGARSKGGRSTAAGETPKVLTVEELPGSFTPGVLKNVKPGFDGYYDEAGNVFLIPNGSSTSGEESPAATDGSVPPKGTLQVGFTLSGRIGTVWVSGFFGVAVDRTGNKGVYAGVGGGPGIGVDANVSLNVWGANAHGIEDLRGLFWTASAGGGALGHVSADGFTGASPHGKVWGGGVSPGLGAGGYVAAGATYTWLATTRQIAEWFFPPPPTLQQQLYLEPARR